MGSIAASIFLTTSYLLQVAPTASPDVNIELARVARNPEALARFIESNVGFDWKVLAQTLGIKNLFIQECQLPGDGSQCWTELVTVLNPDQTILVIHGSNTPSDVYIRYLRLRDGSWHFTGAHEAEIHNHPRRHEVDRPSGQPYLRVSSQGARGSDIDSEMESWFDLRQAVFEPVFVFPVQGYQHRNGFGISRRITSTFGFRREGISVNVEVRFEGVGHRFAIRSYEAVYRKLPGAKRFTLQTAAISVADFEAITDLVEGPSNEALIRMVMSELREIAKGPNSDLKEWLRFMLAQVTVTPEVRELQALLR